MKFTAQEKSKGKPGKYQADNPPSVKKINTTVSGHGTSASNPLAGRRTPIKFNGCCK